MPYESRKAERDLMAACCFFPHVILAAWYREHATCIIPFEGSLCCHAGLMYWATVFYMLVGRIPQRMPYELRKAERERPDGSKLLFP